MLNVINGEKIRCNVCLHLTSWHHDKVAAVLKIVAHLGQHLQPGGKKHQTWASINEATTGTAVYAVKNVSFLK